MLKKRNGNTKGESSIMKRAIRRKHKQRIRAKKEKIEKERDKESKRMRPYNRKSVQKQLEENENIE